MPSVSNVSARRHNPPGESSRYGLIAIKSFSCLLDHSIGGLQLAVNWHLPIRLVSGGYGTWAIQFAEKLECREVSGRVGLQASV